MPVEIAVYGIREHYRSHICTQAMAAGIAKTGDKPVMLWEHEYRGPVAQVAVFYGLEGNLPKIFSDYRSCGSAVYIDLGYWGRRQGGRWSGYHKISVNARHPTDYFQRRRHDASRAKALGVVPQPWRRGQHILLAGMGDKGARAEGFEPEAWERKAIEVLREFTQRPIIYRPKPSWKRARPLPGVGFSPRTEEVETVLRNCHAVVTHHSNVAVDGIVAGVPAFAWAGVATRMGSQDLAHIENPPRPEGREQWIADIAWCQWSIAEMAEGLPWRHLKSEGLIP
jgi:hypothetical protein